MAERGDGRAEHELPDGVLPLPPEAYGPPGGCGFSGCMWMVIIVFSLLMALLVFGLLTRVWITPVVAPR
ncbi:MAG: hypothetical protein KY444_11580 [Gemmatimonadetes bacterium]|nr:hypothetical protein [Gemmatimonadota bacterium]